MSHPKITLVGAGGLSFGPTMVNDVLHTPDLAGKIAKACGGADKLCLGGDDLSLSEIGVSATCPAVESPDSGSCLSTLDSLALVEACELCVNDFKAACTDAATVPQFASYPAATGLRSTRGPASATRRRELSSDT